jgi:tripartite-type tricarboxylate transporter receptor subunit TctC
MNLLKSLARCASAFLVLQFGLAGLASAEFPDKTIRIVVPFAPGGGVDALARPFAKELGDILKQSVIVENKASNTGQIGAIDVARAPADGYTLLITSAAFATTPAFYPKVPYDPVKDFEPVTIVASTPQVLVANANYKANSVRDVLAMAKSGAQVNFALSASTGIQALATELLSTMGGVSFTKVPYKGAGAAFTDLIGGQVDLMIDNPASSMPHVRSGKLKLLATTGAKRMSVLPNTPAVAEVLPGFEALNWFVLAAPAGTPAPVLERLHAATLEAMRRPSMKQFFERDGLDPVGNSRAEAKKFVASEITKWSQIVKDKGLQMQ